MDVIAGSVNGNYLNQIIQKSGIATHEAKYDCFTAYWRDEVIVVTPHGRLDEEDVVFPPGTETVRYPGAYIQSTFIWKGFAEGSTTIHLNDRQIRGILAPALATIKRGDPDAILNLNFQSSVEGVHHQNDINYYEGVFTIYYNNESGRQRFVGSGAQAFFDWLEHLVQYFQEKERTL